MKLLVIGKYPLKNPKKITDAISVYTHIYTHTHTHTHTHILLNHFAVHLKLTQYCKPTIKKKRTLAEPSLSIIPTQAPDM